MERSLAALHPERTLQRGFAMLSHKGEIIPDLSRISAGDELEIQTRSGAARVTVQIVLQDKN